MIAGITQDYKPMDKDGLQLLFVHLLAVSILSLLLGMSTLLYGVILVN